MHSKSPSTIPILNLLNSTSTTVAAVPVPGHSGAARLYSSWCYGATHTAHTPLGLPRSVRVSENPVPSEQP